MNKLKMVETIKHIYCLSGSIILYLRDIVGQGCNALEDIPISYDLQDGTYNAAYKNFQSYITKYIRPMPRSSVAICRMKGISIARQVCFAYRKILYEANSRLINKYLEVQSQHYQQVCEDLYLKQNVEFRGFRQT